MSGVFFFQAEDGIRDYKVTGVQTCALPISRAGPSRSSARSTARASPSTGARTSWSTRAGSARTRSSPVSWPRSGEPMPSAFSQRLDAGPLLCDGAMGTMLYARGVSLDACFDVLNLNNPRLVQAIHAEYVAAGADLIETNTFGANRFKLAAHGLESQVRGGHRRGVRPPPDRPAATGRRRLVPRVRRPPGHVPVPVG